MTIVEGVGDEVTQFFIVVLLLLLGLAAWWSTQIADTPLVRTVLILERRTTQRNTPSGSPIRNVLRTVETTPVAESPHEPSDTGQQSAESVSTNSEGAESLNSVNESPPTDTEKNQTNLTLTPEEGSESVLRRRRIAFLETITNTSTSQNSSVDSNAEDAAAVEEAEIEHVEPSGQNIIRIRLKYLNDEQKLVEGQLHEPLGDFKRRHFSIELGANKLVRLIFNGQVLSRDGASLEENGLFDNCVVHCLVHQPRNSESTQQSQPSSQQQQLPQQQQQQAQAPQVREWDLGSVALMMLSVILGFAWYGRCVYSQYFTTPATVALVGLTGVFVVSVVGLMLPDQEGLRQ